MPRRLEPAASKSANPTAPAPHPGTLTDYWVGFISEGVPSSGAKHVPRLPHWPASPNVTMRLGLVPKVAHGALREHICAFWDAHHPVPYSTQQGS